MYMQLCECIVFDEKNAVAEKPHLHAFVISVIVASGHIELHWAEAG